MKTWKKVLFSLGIIGVCSFSMNVVTFAVEQEQVTETEQVGGSEDENAITDIEAMERENVSESDRKPKSETELQQEDSKTQESEINETDNAVKEQKVGFVQENGKTYYYENGTKLIKKEKCIDGVWYYFGNDGAMATGWTTHHGNQYYYDENGHMAHGVYTVGEKTYGFNEWTGVLLSGEHYFTDGSSDQWYYFSENSVNRGEMATGWTTHHGNKYYYNDKGEMAHGIYKANGTYYGFDEWTGVVLNGEKYIANAWRYFDSNGKMAIGWTKHHGNQYYYNKDGSMFYGELYDNGKWYYFQDVIGVMATGWTDHHGNHYFYDNSGAMIHGEMYLNKEWYYFDESTGVMAIGWTNHHGNRYYYDGYGRMVHGKYKINGSWYYFDEWIGVLKNGWRYENGYKVYYDDNGKLVENVESIIGKQSSYFVKVNTYTNTVTVFAKDGANGYIIPVKKMICSTGSAATPTIKGTYTIRRYGRWGTLMGPVYGQYCSQIYGGYLFHSAWYYTNGDNRSLSVSEYRKLGTNASHGCVRMTVGDAKWIYDNCDGSTVFIYSAYNDGDPFGKPARPNPVVLYGDRGYDPTDPAFY